MTDADIRADAIMNAGSRIGALSGFGRAESEGFTKASTKSPSLKFLTLLLVSLSAFALAAGCGTPQPVRDPLAGWRILLNRGAGKIDKAIIDDYRDYVQKLLTEDKYFIDESNIWFLEDGTGQHAVRIEIPHRGVWLDHILIYDRDDRRIKVIRYTAGTYRS